MLINTKDDHVSTTAYSDGCLMDELGWNQVHICICTILYVWFRKLTQGLLVQHDIITAPHDPIPRFHERQTALPWKTGSNWFAIERRRRFNPWRDRVAEGREWREGDVEATCTSHTGKEGGGRRRKLCCCRTFQNVSARQREVWCITDVMNFCGSQESMAAETLKACHQKPTFHDIWY